MRALTMDEVGVVGGGIAIRSSKPSNVPFQDTNGTWTVPVNGAGSDMGGMPWESNPGVEWFAAYGMMSLEAQSDGGGGGSDQSQLQPVIVTAEKIQTNASDMADAAGIKIKVGPAGANISNLDQHLQDQLFKIQDVYSCIIGNPTPWITAGNDGRHMKNSLHYENRAIDLRANDLTAGQAAAIVSLLYITLPDGYYIQYETFPNPQNNHIHIEYDPRN